MCGARLWLSVLLATSVLCGAEAWVMDEAIVEILWEEGLHAAILRVRLDDPNPPTEGTATWVITSSAQRFRDGVYAWQLHFGDDPNVLVIPNDFLMIRRFTFDQLGIEVLTHLFSRELALRIPRAGMIPNLILPNDSLDVHALWVRMEPLATVAVPPFREMAMTAGGGAAIEEADASAQSLSSTLLPEQSVFLVGEPIRHWFVLIDPRTGEPDLWAFAQCELVRRSGDGWTILQHFAIPVEEDTGVFRLDIDTAALEPAVYELSIWCSSAGCAASKQIEIREP